jgi:hypothetical protein
MADVISTPSSFGDAAVELYYGGQRLYPAPLIDFNRSTNRASDDAALSVEDTWSLRGVYINNSNMGYENVVSEMEDLKTIFAQDGLELVIKAGGGSSTLPSGTLITSGIYPFVESISIPEEVTQFHRFSYEVTLVAKSAASGVSGVVENATDNWQFNENNDRLTTTVQHSVGAKGINTNTSGVSNALDNAKAFVDSRLGVGALPANYPSYVIPGDVDGDISTIFEFQRTRSESVNVEDGSYDVTETFVFVSGAVPYSDGRTYSYDKTKEGIVTVNINGTLEGYPRSDGTDEPYSAFYNAQSGWTAAIEPYLYSEANEVYSRYGASGTLANKAINYNITENRFLGTLGYSISYTDDPGENLPSGIVEQSITIQRTDALRMQQSHVIPHRRLGNIIQDIGTPTEGQFRMVASARAENTNDAVADTNRAISHIQDLINQQRPNPSEFITLRMLSKDQSHDKLSLTANATIVYAFTVDLATVQEANTDITLNPVT